VETLNVCEYDLPSFAQHLEALVTEFGNRFSHFTMCISNPFATVDVSELGGEVCEIFGNYRKGTVPTLIGLPLFLAWLTR
jgi:hypothetical protein